MLIRHKFIESAINTLLRCGTQDAGRRGINHQDCALSIIDADAVAGPVEQRPVPFFAAAQFDIDLLKFRRPPLHQLIQINAMFLQLLNILLPLSHIPLNGNEVSTGPSVIIDRAEVDLHPKGIPTFFVVEQFATHRALLDEGLPHLV